MAYNPYEAVSRIFNLKGEWSKANNEGDRQRANKAALAAQEYYAQLRNNNHGSLANELESKDYGQANHVKDYYAKTGNTEFRPYMYSLGSKYGLSEADVDKLIKWDEGTGEIAFGGKKIGKPNALAGGSSYFQDTSVLDNVFNEYAKRTGLTKPVDMMYKQGLENIQGKINQSWGMAVDDKADMGGRYNRLEEYNYGNPFETETGKAILGRYDLKGLQGRDNEVASGSANNSGNIDSFSAANALRQQASLRNMGEQTAIAAHRQTVDSGRGILGDRGNYNQRIYDTLERVLGLDMSNNQRIFANDQTAQNNQVARDTQGIQNDLAVAETFGRATSNQYTNPYIGKNMDFKAAYDQAKANGASAEVLNQLAEARFMKQVAANDFSAEFIPFEPTSRETANMLLTNKQIDSAERMATGADNTKLALADKEADTQKYTVDTQAETQKYTVDAGTNKEKPSMTYSQALSNLQKGIVTQPAIDIFNATNQTGYTIDNPPKFDGDGKLTNLNSDNESGIEAVDFNEEDIQSEITSVQNSATKKQKEFMDYFLKNREPIGEEELKNLVIEKSKDYDLEVDFIQKLFNAYGFSAAWLSEYKNKGWFGGAWGSGIKQR